jgi:hemin uptake protein HemP
MFVAQPHTRPHAPHHAGDRAPTAEAIEVDSTRLLKGQRELLIRHGSECYRLRHTRNDKLILTK